MGTYPPYFIYGPMVFSVATRQMLAHLDNNAQMLRMLSFLKSPLATMAFDPPSPDLEELVVLSSAYLGHRRALAVVRA